MYGAEINHWAVLVAALVDMFVGFMWYGPVFGKVWMKYMGFTKESMKNMKLNPTQSMVLGFATALLMAYVLNCFMSWSQSDTLGWEGAWKLSFALWLGFMVPHAASAFIWAGKPFGLFALNAANQLVSLFLMSLVFVFW